MSGAFYSEIDFNMGFLIGLKAFTAAVLGGIGNIPGAMLGGYVLGLLETFATGYISAAWKDVFAFSILILVLVVRPTGILGERGGEGMTRSSLWSLLSPRRRSIACLPPPCARC